MAGCRQQELTPQQTIEMLQSVHNARSSVSLEGQLMVTTRIGERYIQSASEIRRSPQTVQIEFTDGRFAGWKVIEQDRTVFRVSPRGELRPAMNLGGLEPNIPPMLPGMHLKVVHAGGGKVAGRKVERYRLYPPGASEARVQWALDRDKHYPLHVARYDSSGELVSESQFSSVRFDVPAVQPYPLTPEEMARIRPGMPFRPASEQELEAVVGGPLLRPSYLPEGFQEQGLFAHRLRQRPVATIRYSDGMRSLMVTQGKRPLPEEQRPASGSRPRDGAPRPGEQMWRPGDRPTGPWQNQQAPGRMERDGMERGPGQGQWQGQRQERPEGAPGFAPEGDERSGMWRSRLRGKFVRELRGDRVIMVGGDLPVEELQKVADSIPESPTTDKPVQSEKTEI